MRLRTKNFQSRGQCGRMGRALDFYFFGPRFKSSNLQLTGFVLGCTLYISNIVIKITLFISNVDVQFVSVDKKSHSWNIQCKIPSSFIIIFLISRFHIDLERNHPHGLTKPLTLYYCT